MIAGAILKRKGFSLAELLLALLILGQIAAFTIPKVLAAQESSSRKAVLKETYAMLNEIVYRGYLMNEMRGGYNGSYLLNRVNAVKLCSSNAFSQQCWTQTDTSGWDERSEAGFVLHSGATVAGLNDHPNVAENGLIIDWNGPKPPNLEGQDQLVLIMCFSKAGPCGGGALKAGTVAAAPGNAASVALEQELFR